MNGQDSQIAYHRSLKEQASANACAFIFNKDKYTANEAVYLQGLYDIATKGRVKYSRPGQATLSLSGTQQRFDLTDGKIPLLGSKEIFHRSFLIENQWFLSGDDDIKFLKDRNVSIWDSWVIPETAVFEPTEKQTGSDVETYMRCYAPTFYKDVYIPWKRNRGLAFPTAIQIKEFFDKWMDDNRGADFQGELHAFATRPVVKLVAGKIGAGAYGPAWRKWEDTRFVKRTNEQEDATYLKRGFCLNGDDHHYDVYKRNIDQFADAVKMLRTGADSRRIIVSAWNAAKIDEAALPPCHSFVQFTSYDNFDGGPRDLVCNLYQRSGDFPTGGPFNVAQYAALTHLIAKITNHRAIALVRTCGDDHIYADQIPFLKEQFDRPPINLGAATIEYPDHIKELQDYIDLPVTEVEKLIKNYGAENHHPPIRYPVAV